MSRHVTFRSMRQVASAFVVAGLPVPHTDSENVDIAYGFDPPTQGYFLDVTADDDDETVLAALYTHLPIGTTKVGKGTMASVAYELGLNAFASHLLSSDSV